MIVEKICKGCIEKRTVWFLMLLLFFSGTKSQTIKRLRNESTMNIPSSNVLGNGNISAASFLIGNYSESGGQIRSKTEVAIGIVEIMQLMGQINIVNFNSISTAAGRIQLTTPDNDHFRFFGVGLSGDLYLSTFMDTGSIDADSEKPDYHFYICPSLIVDLDWLALSKSLPLKTYFVAGTVDNSDLLHKYDQLSFKTGFELKLNYYSVFSDFGYNLYKEKATSEYSADKSYEQQVFWIEPGIRYRLFGKICLSGSIRVLVFQKVKAENPLEAQYARASLGISIPVLFRETNTEAIRSLIFSEQKKTKKKDIISRSIEEGKVIKTDFEITFEDLQKELSDDISKNDQIKKREMIQQKMNEIESLLEELDEEN